MAYIFGLIHGSQEMRTLTPRGHSLVEYVKELIDPHTDDWDEQLVSDLFWEEDAAVILALPVHQGRENFISWHYDKLGMLRTHTRSQGKTS